MVCPRCKAEYRLGFARYTDWDIDLVGGLLLEVPEQGRAREIVREIVEGAPPK
jgi:hypothetical protein